MAPCRYAELRARMGAQAGHARESRRAPVTAHRNRHHKESQHKQVSSTAVNSLRVEMAR